jgi:site-specific DNA-methyltransferase (adenine-specific)
MKLKDLSIDLIQEYENNPRFNDQAVDVVVESIKEFGFKVPIVIDKNNMIVTGHTRLKAAKKLGLKKVPCIVADDLTPEQIKAFRLADNKAAEIATWDENKLYNELLELKVVDFNIETFGFDTQNIDVLNADVDGIKERFENEATTNEIVEDEIPELPKEPISKYGEIYQLGNHKLICGDSTIQEDVEKLMNGFKADMVFTDPPYNVAFNGRSGKFDVIENDNLSEKDFEEFINKSIDIIKFLNPPTYYIWCNWKFYGILQEKLKYKSCIVWAKNVFGMGNGYRHQHEFCLFNGTIDDHIKNETDLWKITKDNNYIHPTQKPVELCGRALRNHSQANIILDLFGGSGSTLIACEQLNRSCYMMELDPKYIDVIIERWENFTGEKAVKIN